MVFLELFKNFLLDYGFLLSFLGGLFGGEESILFLAFLSSNGLISPWIVFVFSFLGVFICDLTLFLIGRSRLVKNLSQFEKVTYIHTTVDKLVTKLSLNKLGLALLYSRFFIGVKSVMLVCLGLRNGSIIKFIIYDLLAGLIWLTIFMYIGYFAGTNFFLILNYLGNLKLAIFFLISLLVILIVLRQIFSKNLPRIVEKLSK